MILQPNSQKARKWEAGTTVCSLTASHSSSRDLPLQRPLQRSGQEGWAGPQQSGPMPCCRMKSQMPATPKVLVFCFHGVWASQLVVTNLSLTGVKLAEAEQEGREG